MVTGSHEIAYYTPNAAWDAKTNRQAKGYVGKMVRFMNSKGWRNFPHTMVLSYPLKWHVTLSNEADPSGAVPMVVWSLNIPAQAQKWSAIQWQSALDLVETQEYTGGLDAPARNLLTNSNNAVNQWFDLVEPNRTTVRFADANTLPKNTVGITTPVMTTGLIWRPSGDASFRTVWRLWIAPSAIYPQLASVSEQHATAILSDLKTSGAQLWSALHATKSSRSSP
jgi:hypothetical protein